MNTRICMAVVAACLGLAARGHASEEEFLKWAEVRIVSPGAGLTREEEIVLEGLLRQSELIVAGKLRRTDDSAADKMWAGHVEVSKVLLGDPSTRDVHVHFQAARRGAARRETGQTGVWFVFRDGGLYTVVWPDQLQAPGYEKTLGPCLKRFLKQEIERLVTAGRDKNAARLAHLKANYQAVRVAGPTSPPRAAANGQLTMQLSYVVSKPVPVPPAARKLFRDIVARPPARWWPEPPWVAEPTARFRLDGRDFDWWGNVIGMKSGEEPESWDCPALAVLWQRMMRQRAFTDEKLKALLDQFEKDLSQGKLPLGDEAAVRASQRLAVAKQQLAQAVGGTWQTQTRDEHPLGPVLVGKVEVDEGRRPHPAAYVVLPFPYDAFGRLRTWAQYRAGSHTFCVLGANDAYTVLTNTPSYDTPVSRGVMKTLGLSTPKITLAAMSMAEHLRQQREKITFTLEWHGPGTQRLPSLGLGTTPPQAAAGPGPLWGRMSAFAARNLVDHCLDEGMLDPFDSAAHKPVAGPFCLLRIRAPAPDSSTEEIALVNVLGWGEPLRKHLHGIRVRLEGDAATAMDKLIGAFEKAMRSDTGSQPGQDNRRGLSLSDAHRIFVTSVRQQKEQLERSELPRPETPPLQAGDVFVPAFGWIKPHILTYCLGLRPVQ